MAALNFMSYNSTGLDNAKIVWINDLIKTFNIDFMQLQEHFKAYKSVDTIFKRAFPDYDNFTVPAYKEPGQQCGRAKGGLS